MNEQIMKRPSPDAVAAVSLYARYCFSPLCRRTSELSLEISAEVRVIGKAACQGNLLNWKSLVCQEVFGFIHADLQ